MRIINIIILTIAVSLAVNSCKPSQKTMTMEDFIKIDMKIVTTDQKPESMEKVAKEYGYTLKQYNDFAKKVEKDPKLIKERGEIFLKKQETDKKK